MPHVDTPTSLCRFGCAGGDITPPVGAYHRMWGAAAHDRSTGIHRPLWATALTIRPAVGDGEIILVAVDHCLLFGQDMDLLRRRLAESAGVPEGTILVAFSHTHGAGLMDSSRAHLPGGDLIAPYLAEMAERVAGFIRQSRRSVQEAVITYGTGHCGLAAHRDLWDEKTQQFVCGFNPDGPVDDTVLVARVSRPDGTPLATLVNYACHPTTLAWQNTLVSPDYVGALREVVERETGVPCVFLQGASGDIGPREGFVGDLAVADRNGRQLGHVVLAALAGLPPPATRFAYLGPVVSGATIGTWAHQPLPPERGQEIRRWRLKQWTLDLLYRTDLPTIEQTRQDRDRWREQEAAARQAGDQAKASDCRAMVERADRRLTRLALFPPGPTFPFPITLCQLGDAFWLALEAEHYNLLQRSLRQRLGDTPLMVLTLVNGSRPFYLPVADAYGKGIYQESVAALAAGTLETLIEAIAVELAAWRSQP